MLTLSGNNARVIGIAFSPDEKRLVTESWSDDLEFPAKIWDAANGKLWLTVSGHTKGVYAVAVRESDKLVIPNCQSLASKCSLCTGFCDTSTLATTFPAICVSIIGYARTIWTSITNIGTTRIIDFFARMQCLIQPA